MDEFIISVQYDVDFVLFAKSDRIGYGRAFSSFPCVVGRQ